MGNHAKLAPSSAYRWLKCPGSVELCANVIDAGSEYADEGTAGHEVFARLLLGKPIPKEVVVADDGRTYPVTLELVELVEPCVEWALEYKRKHNAAIFSEQKYEIGAGFGLRPGVFWGTADYTAVSTVELCVADLKLGYVDVGIGENEQLISYALGALDATGWMHDQIRLVILQPKTSDEPKEILYTADEMEGFRQSWKERVLTASIGGPLIPDEEACRFCKAAGACPALRAETLALAQREMVNLITLSGEEIADLLNKGTMIENAMKSVRAHALRLLELNPDAVPGYKRVEGEKKRRWKSEDTAASALEDLGLDLDVIAPRKLTTPAQAEKALAEYNRPLHPTKKAALEEAKKIVSDLAEKPKGEATLAKTEDERPALGPVFTEEDLLIEGEVLEVID